MNSITILFKHIKKIFDTIFVDESLTSDEFVELMSNKEDREKYLEGIDKATKTKTDIVIDTQMGKIFIKGT